MMAVLTFIGGKHDHGLLLLAAMLCVAGSVAALRLFSRAVTADARGLERHAWLFLAAVVAGFAIWCTHYVATLAYVGTDPDAHGPGLAAVSLLVAIGGAYAGFAIAALRTGRRASWAGGAVLGLTIGVMHYLGAFAAEAESTHWHLSYIVASLLMVLLFGALALAAARGAARTLPSWIAAPLLIAAISSLHFTSVTAAETFHALPYKSSEGTEVLAIAAALVGLVVIAAGAMSWLIDARLRQTLGDKLSMMALTDPLTGLPNRAGFEALLAEKIAWAQQTQARFAVVSIDMDRFDGINDSYGHLFGDLVLRAVSARLSDGVGSESDGSERVGRLGGDEFGALKRYSTQAELTLFLARIREACSRPIEIEGVRVEIAASVGVAVYPDDSQSADMLVNNAALARSRATGDTPLCFYDGCVDEVVRKQRSLASDLRLAIQRGQLQLFYQPQTSLRDGALVGFESLARWNHPVRGPISPA